MDGRSIICVGNFDGVHAGHRAILREGRRVGDEHGVSLIALTFEPHPAAVLRPGRQPARICSHEQKLHLLREAGADEVIVLEPTSELLGQTPAQFVGDLVKRHRPIAFVEGPNFRFGKDRQGDVEALERLGAEHGFETHVVPPVQTPLLDQLVVTVSSSLIRWLIKGGRVADAGRCLAGPHTLIGRVVKGEKRGRSIDVPTANFDPGDFEGRLLPAQGVYAGEVVIEEDGPKPRPAAISIGVKPTFGRHALCIEAHLLDFDGDLYGRTITMRFARWLRCQQPFPSPGDLVRQLQRDIAAVRRYHAFGLLDPNSAAVTAATG